MELQEKRSERTKELVRTLANIVFPFTINSYNILLDEEPKKLIQPNFAYKRDLRETEISFDPYNRFKEEMVLDGITKYGAYDKPEEYFKLISVCTKDVELQFENLIDQIIKGSYRYGGIEKTFSIKLLKHKKVIVEKPEDYINSINNFLSGLQSNKSIFLVYAPEKGYSRFNYKSPYYQVKRLLLEKGYPSQMVDESTLADPKFKDLNLALDIYAKLGYTPWVLSEGFPDVDLFIGLSYSSIVDLGGIKRIIGYINVFDKMGRWRFYKGNSKFYDFEERKKHLTSLISETVLQINKERKIKKIHIHHSHKLSVDIKESIYQELVKIIPQIELFFVWVNDKTPVRLYDDSLYSDGSLYRGSYVVTSLNQFYISTTGYNQLKQKGMGTPKILEVNIDTIPNSLVIDPKLVAQHILSLTKLNWASTKSFCHLPITLKYANDIAYLMNALTKTEHDFKLHKELEDTPWFI